MQENMEYVADLVALVVCLAVYAGLEAGHPRSTFLITSLLYQYSYPLMVCGVGVSARSKPGQMGLLGDWDIGGSGNTIALLP